METKFHLPSLRKSPEKRSGDYSLNVEISVGDFFDRMSILSIKYDNGLFVQRELEIYNKLSSQFEEFAFNRYFNIIKSVNEQLWELEDKKRKGVERYSREESDVAYMITELNDLRHKVKKAIDNYFNSEFTEEKSH